MLAVGGHLKNAFCLTRGRNAHQPAIGDLEDTDARYRRSVVHFESFCRCHPRAWPATASDFLSTRYAERLQGAACRSASSITTHLAAVLADNHLDGPAIGLICDGTGYGADGTVWGCEVLVGSAAGYERAGHLRTIRLAGGEAAIKEPWRVAATWLQEAFGPDFLDELDLPFVARLTAGPGTSCRE